MNKLLARIRYRLPPRPTPAAFVVSYPKTGRTWLRAMIGKYLCDRDGLPPRKLLDTGLLTFMAGLPVARFTHDRSAMADRRTADQLTADKSAYRDCRVVLLTRDPGDTIVSAYFQATKRIGVYEGTIADFIRSPRFGVAKMLTFYRQWHDQRTVPRGLLHVSYEDLHADAHDTLARTLRFLGVEPVDDALVRAAVEFCSFDNLRRLESRTGLGARPEERADADDAEGYKVRKGKVGGHTDYLTADDNAYIDEQIALLGCAFTQRI